MLRHIIHALLHPYDFIEDLLAERTVTALTNRVLAVSRSFNYADDSATTKLVLHKCIDKIDRGVPLSAVSRSIIAAYFNPANPAFAKKERGVPPMVMANAHDNGIELVQKVAEVILDAPLADLVTKINVGLYYTTMIGPDNSSVIQFDFAGCLQTDPWVIAPGNALTLIRLLYPSYDGHGFHVDPYLRYTCAPLIFEKIDGSWRKTT